MIFVPLLLVAVASAGATAATTAAGKFAEPPIAVGINIDPSNAQYGNPSHDAAAALGASWVRIEYKDMAPAGQPPTSAALSFYHSAAAAMASASPPVSVLMILDYSALVGHPGPDDSDEVWAAYNAAFAERCAAVVEAMGPLVAAYEVWNEPDLPSVGDVPAHRFGPLLGAAYKAIHAAFARSVEPRHANSSSADLPRNNTVGNNKAHAEKTVAVAGSASSWPSNGVTVVLGGLASGDPSYVSAVQAAAGGTLPADAVGIHPYGQRPTPDWPSPTWGFGVLTDLLAR
jgi:hypothetical protein